MTTDVEALEALDKIEEIVKADESAEGLESLDSICQKYNSIKPYLNTILPWLERFPITAKVATAIRFLIVLADQVCPAK